MKRIEPISIDSARPLLDFRGASLSHSMAEDQLTGTVAIHNILARERFAYLADEVGMGKTYVALGVAALIRYFDPTLRVLYIAPRENIQIKWVKELRNFTRRNWQQTDLRVRDFDGAPAFNFVSCHGLADWARQAVRDPNRDFFLRLTSFSFPLPAESEKWRAKRDEIERLTAAARHGHLDLHNKDEFKRAYARTVNRLLPHYDLLVVDEAHNLKGGVESQTSRNELLALTLGSRDGEGAVKRFDRVLFLSATPVESDFADLWRQLDLFGFGDRLRVLADEEADERVKRERVAKFMVRRLTGLTIVGERHTKNMYRREWRGGGCRDYDEPLEVPDERRRLIVALVQKKVAEVLNDPRFGASFQIGMLASFESFLETAKVKDDEDEPVFDQTGDARIEDEREREGVDRQAVNRLADSYRRTFGEPMPHPKMDAVVDSLWESFATGEKALVFVRRIKSVTELKEKLCRAYDAWLKMKLTAELPGLGAALNRQWEHYEAERLEGERRRERRQKLVYSPPDEDDQGEHLLVEDDEGEADEGGSDTFFAWFFRGTGPPGVLSGAAFRKNRLMNESSVHSTFFEDNYVAALLGDPASPADVLPEALGLSADETEERLRQFAYQAYAVSASRSKKATRKYPRRLVYRAYQEGALELLARSGAVCAEEAKTIQRERFGGRVTHPSPAPANFPVPRAFINARTLFSELRRRPALCNALWSDSHAGTFQERFRSREVRRELLAATTRLGHSFIDLWAVFIKRVGSLSLRSRGGETDPHADTLVDEYLDLIEQQRHLSGFHAFRELSELAEHFDLILSTNFPEAETLPLSALPRLFGPRLGAQTPVGGMSGEVSPTLVTQFRLPGYPFVLVTTDVLQEGEDLHTFCSRVIHYGMSWTPSAMEQRTGRVDRINSLTHRRLDGRAKPAAPDELLQVYYPYLRDTVEVLQVRRVFERMNRFVRMLHRAESQEDFDSKIHTSAEFVRVRREFSQLKTLLETVFPVRGDDLAGREQLPDQPLRQVASALKRLRDVKAQIERSVHVEWEEHADAWALYGTVYLDGNQLLQPPDSLESFPDAVRRQPFALLLKSSRAGGHVLLHGVSPVGKLFIVEGEASDLVRRSYELRGVKLCEIPAEEAGTYSLTVEGDILFDSDLTQIEEVMDMLTRLTVVADLVERERLGGKDASFSEFRPDLFREARRRGKD